LNFWQRNILQNSKFYPPKKSAPGSYIFFDQPLHGIYYFPDGNKYDGGWERNQFHGKGTMYLADGKTLNMNS